MVSAPANASSLPGMALCCDIWACLPIRLLEGQYRDLYLLIKDGLVGGPSIIFNRYHKRWEAFICANDYGSEARQCRGVLGTVANTVYLYCILQDMPTGSPIHFKSFNGVYHAETRRSSKVEHGWLYRINRICVLTIWHQHNGTKVKLGEHGLPIAGYCTTMCTAFQFHECFWHRHNCSKQTDRCWISFARIHLWVCS